MVMDYELEYPARHWQILEGLKQQFLATVPDGWSGPPSEWMTIAPPVAVPFVGGQRKKAVQLQIVKKFTSKAAPFLVRMKDDRGEVTEVVMKEEDDLRQDQVVLGMMELFNLLWARSGTYHNTQGGDRVSVYAPLCKRTAALSICPSR